MIPKTELEKTVVELSTKLKDITPEQEKFGFDSCLSMYGIYSRKTFFCFECGHEWKNSNPDEVVVCKLIDCPGCNNKIEIKPFTQPHFKEMMYYALLDTVYDFQVVRMFSITKEMRKREKAECYSIEVMQHWISPAGKVTTLSAGVQGLSRYYDQWAHGSKLEIRSKSERERMRYNLKPYKIYPIRKISKYAKRNGYKGNFYGLTPQEFFSLILIDQFAETALKAKQISLFKYYADGHYNIAPHWNSIKICIRNNYIIKDYSIYRDYLDLLLYFNRDMRNTKYVCPADLQHEHDKLVSKKRKIQRRLKYQEMKKELEAAQVEYEKHKKVFFGLFFQSGNITVNVIETVRELMDEGDVHNHCVFTNEYHKKMDSLVLSAKVEDKPIETIEVSLSKMKILQARGHRNKPTSHHSKIIQLVNTNLPMIQERLQTLKQA